LEEELSPCRNQTLTSALVAATLALGVGCTGAAETGTKTVPDAAVNPPPTRAPIYETISHYDGYLPSGSCGNRHGVQS
jgi:hypothetical protein